MAQPLQGDFSASPLAGIMQGLMFSQGVKQEQQARQDQLDQLAAQQAAQQQQFGLQQQGAQLNQDKFAFDKDQANAVAQQTQAQLDFQKQQAADLKARQARQDAAAALQDSTKIVADKEKLIGAYVQTTIPILVNQGVPYETARLHAVTEAHHLYDGNTEHLGALNDHNQIPDEHRFVLPTAPPPSSATPGGTPYDFMNPAGSANPIGAQQQDTPNAGLLASLLPSLGASATVPVGTAQATAQQGQAIQPQAADGTQQPTSIDPKMFQSLMPILQQAAGVQPANTQPQGAGASQGASGGNAGQSPSGLPAGLLQGLLSPQGAMPTPSGLPPIGVPPAIQQKLDQAKAALDQTRANTELAKANAANTTQLLPLEINKFKTDAEFQAASQAENIRANHAKEQLQSFSQAATQAYQRAQIALKQAELDGKAGDVKATQDQFKDLAKARDVVNNQAVTINKSLDALRKEKAEKNALINHAPDEVKDPKAAAEYPMMKNFAQQRVKDIDLAISNLQPLADQALKDVSQYQQAIQQRQRVLSGGGAPGKAAAPSTGGTLPNLAPRTSTNAAPKAKSGATVNDLINKYRVK